MNLSTSILNSNNLKDFYNQIGYIESKKVGYFGRVVVIQGCDYYFSHIVDKYFELIRNRDCDPECLIPKIFKILSRHQNEFCEIYYSKIANFLPDYLGKMQAEHVNEIQLLMPQKKFAHISVQPTTKELENIIDNLASLKFDCAYLVSALNNLFLKQKPSLDNERKVNLLHKAYGCLLKDKNTLKYLAPYNLKYLPKMYASYLHDLPNEDQMIVLAKILKENPEFVCQILKSFPSLLDHGLVSDKNVTSLKDNELFSIIMRLAVQFSNKPNLSKEFFFPTYLCHFDSTQEVSNYIKNVNLFLCANKFDNESFINFKNGFLKEILELIIYKSLEHISSKAISNYYYLFKRIKS